MTCRDAPDWTDTIYEIQQPSPGYPHGVYSLDGAAVFDVSVFGEDEFYEFYTVPAGKVVYITLVHLQMRTVLDNVYSVWVGFETLPGAAWPFFWLSTTVAGIKENHWIFPVPIRCGEGSQFTYRADDGALGHAHFLGYILDA